jgi:hypothetical protein
MEREGAEWGDMERNEDTRSTEHNDACTFPGCTFPGCIRICACGRPTTDRYAKGQAQCLRCAHSKPADPREVDDEDGE